MNAVTTLRSAPANQRPVTLAGMLALAPANSVALTFGNEELTYAQLRSTCGRSTSSCQCALAGACNIASAAAATSSGVKYSGRA